MQANHEPWRNWSEKKIVAAVVPSWVNRIGFIGISLFIRIKDIWPGTSAIIGCAVEFFIFWHSCAICHGRNCSSVLHAFVGSEYGGQHCLMLSHSFNHIIERSLIVVQMESADTGAKTAVRVGTVQGLGLIHTPSILSNNFLHNLVYLAPVPNHRKQMSQQWSDDGTVIMWCVDKDMTMLVPQWLCLFIYIVNCPLSSKTYSFFLVSCRLRWKTLSTTHHIRPPFSLPDPPLLCLHFK